MSQGKPLLVQALVTIAVLFIVFKVIPATWKEAITGIKTNTVTSPPS